VTREHVPGSRPMIWGYRVAMLVPRTGKGGRPLMPGWKEVYWSESESEARKAWSELRDRNDTRYRFGRSWRGST
jgi:hypothetical protein